MVRAVPVPGDPDVPKSRRLLLTFALGLAGTAILIALGGWQLQRLAWKQAILDEIRAQITAEPVSLPADPHPAEDRFLPVRVSGEIGEGEILVQSSLKLAGPGYRVIAPFETGEGRRILLDRGFIPAGQRDADRPAGPVEVIGNLHWPDEINAFTPDPDREAGLWFARDVASLADALGTEPVIVIARTTSADGAGIVALPVTADGIPNNH